jgi:DNA-binding transcriptional LysR family regulator
VHLSVRDRPVPVEVLTMIVYLCFTMLELKRLRLLRELNARGTIGAVALALDYSPSAVSQQLALLEREAGVPLLERVGRNVRLTAAAQQLVHHTDALLARMEEAESDLQATAEQITGTLRVAAIQSAGLYLLAPALRALAREHPALRVEVTDAEPETSLPSLALGTLDMVLADQYPFLPRAPDERLDLGPLLEEQCHVVLPADHPLASAEGPVALSSLRDEAWAIGKDDSAFAE